ncbi:helicase HerA-like domain-containing protein [Kitasatospora aureofaciens]|uniref:helicase HerA-like domain-containing protein n=1 Tax=Kitasatospora aureofaciens TaxID=1894 RepID=UPI0036F49BC1
MIAEQLSAQDVPVFLADIEGDVSGIARARHAERAHRRPGRRGRAAVDAAGLPGGSLRPLGLAAARA